MPASELCRGHGTRNAGVKKGVPSLIAQMKDMAEQNSRLNKMYAEMSMQNALLMETLGIKL